MRINPYRTQLGAWVPNGVLEITSIGTAAKLLYGRLCQFAGERGYCWPSIGTLARTIAVTRTTTKKAIKELEAAKLIEVVHRQDKEGDDASNLYYFLDHPALHTRMLQEFAGSGPETDLPQKLPHTGQKLAPKRFKEEIQIQTTTPPGSSSTVRLHQPTLVIPEAIMELIPPEKRSRRHLTILSAALAVAGEQITAFNIRRALQAATSHDPWGMVMSMLGDLSDNNDWYREIREREIAEIENRANAISHRQHEAEAEQRRHLLDLKRQARLTQIMESLSDTDRQEIEGAAKHECERIGVPLSSTILRASVLNILEERYHSCAL
jgi:hypothetical protein